jgi:hypothetical protein
MIFASVVRLLVRLGRLPTVGGMAILASHGKGRVLGPLGADVIVVAAMTRNTSTVGALKFWGHAFVAVVAFGFFMSAGDWPKIVVYFERLPPILRMANAAHFRLVTNMHWIVGAAEFRHVALDAIAQARTVTQRSIGAVALVVACWCAEQR